MPRRGRGFLAIAVPGWSGFCGGGFFWFLWFGLFGGGLLAVVAEFLWCWPFVDLFVAQLRHPLRLGSWGANGEFARASWKRARLVRPGVATNRRDDRPSKVNEARQQVLICQANLDFICRL